jgi:hypothetical protein
MSRRARLAFVGACLAAFVVVATWVNWSTHSTRPFAKTSPTVTLAPGAPRPAGLTVTELRDVGQLRALFNADQGHPRLVLALAPT